MSMSENLIGQDDFVIGDDWPFEREYTGAPVGTSIDQVILTIKETEDDADPGVGQVTITSTLSTDGQITQNGATGTVAFKILFPRAKTSLMTLRQYVMDFQLRHSGTGLKITREKRLIFPVAEVTKS